MPTLIRVKHKFGSTRRKPIFIKKIFCTIKTNKRDIRFLTYLESKEPKHQTVMYSQQHGLGYIHRQLYYLLLIIYRSSLKIPMFELLFQQTIDQYFLYPAILKGINRKGQVTR